MTCEEILHQLGAFVDGEVSLEDRRRITAHLESCASCRARVEDLRMLGDSIRSELGDMRAPSDLWARIEAELEPADDHRKLAEPAAWWWRDVRSMALAASVALAIGMSATVGWWQLRSDHSIVTAPVQDFTTYRVSGRSLDVESSEPSIVKAWFEEKLTFELPAIEPRIAGFDLVGGRLCWLLERRISALAYKRGDQKIAVYVMADHDLSLPEASFAPELRISRSVHEVDDVNTMIWQSDGLVYAVVSDLKKADLSIFLAALARSERQNAAMLRDFLSDPKEVKGAST